MSVVYFIQAGAGGPIKIGIAANLQRRIATLQTGCPEPLVVLGTIAGGPLEEARLHAHLRAFRIRGEWFKPSELVLSTVQQALRGEMPGDAALAADGTYSWLSLLVQLVRDQVRQPGWSPTRLAVAAGLHRNTLLGCEADDWNPSLATLLAIEKFVQLPLPCPRGEAGPVQFAPRARP
jgi:DNA-binding XRE family transcriptional regulator